MRKIYLLLTCLVIMGAMNKSTAQGTLIHYWNFNNFTASITLPAIANIGADYSVLDTNKARLLYMPVPGTSSAYSDYCDFVTGDTTNARMGAVAGNGFRARNPNDSMEILLFIPSTGYKNLQLKYACQLSSYGSGDSVNVFAYSLDSGTTWISSGTGLSEWVDSGSLAYRLISVHINDTNANNNHKLAFRITTKGRNHTSGGNDRFDNITLDGDATGGGTGSGVAAVNAAASVYNVFPNPVNTTLTIQAQAAGLNNIVIRNLAGQVIYNSKHTGLEATIDVANFSAGVYFLSIENINGAISNLKFVKH